MKRKSISRPFGMAPGATRDRFDPHGQSNVIIITDPDEIRKFSPPPSAETLAYIRRSEEACRPKRRSNSKLIRWVC